MTAEIATAASQLAVWTPEQVELIKRTVCKGGTDDELQLFMHVAKKSGLDPFSRQIYAIKRWDSREKKEVMQAQTSIDGYRLIAERTGRYVPGPKPTFAYKPDRSLLSATAYIKKLAGDEWHTIEAEAFWDEYAVSYEKDGVKKLGPMWTKMPHVMLAKCAESLVIRRAFPNETNGIYTTEEMSSANVETPKQPAIRMPEAIASTVVDVPSDREDVPGEEKAKLRGTENAAPKGAPTLTGKQQGLLFFTIKKKGWSEGDLKAWTTKQFGKDNPTQMTNTELNRTLDQLKSIPDVIPEA